MKRLFATLAICLMLCSCGQGPRGLLSQRVQTVELVLHTDRPALIAAATDESFDVEGMLQDLADSNLLALELQCPRNDSSRMAMLAEPMTVPVQVLPKEGSVRWVTAEYEGIWWEPRYQWSLREESCDIQAMVLVHNETGQEWSARLVRLRDHRGLQVAKTENHLSIPPGEVVVQWWSSVGVPKTPRLIYGWPSGSRWNAVVPCIMSTPGPLITDTHNDSDLPRMTGDTLWLPLEGLELCEEKTQRPNGYHCRLLLENNREIPVLLRTVVPSSLDRGAVIEFGPDFPEEIYIAPGDTSSLEYRIVYPYAPPSNG